MRVVILELRDHQAAVMDQKGIVRIIPDESYAVGQVLEMTEQELDEAEAAGRHRTGRRKGSGKGKSSYETTVKLQRRLSKRMAPIAAACAIFLVAGSGYAVYALPVGTVTLDVNPSLKYSLNLLDQVLTVESYEETDEELAGEIQTMVKGKGINDALDITLDTFCESDVIHEADTPVVVTVNDLPVKMDSLEKHVASGLEQWNDRHKKEKKKFSVDPSVIPVSGKDHRDADEKKESPGRPYLRKMRREKGLD